MTKSGGTFLHNNKFDLNCRHVNQFQTRLPYLMGTWTILFALFKVKSWEEVSAFNLCYVGFMWVECVTDSCSVAVRDAANVAVV